ncbi:MAG: hypothetical protein HeimC2_10980 [Candidatus Heimdallarchaeota archaeon LC_2]|nr:MAG: hypothetical protein HeimC2_10970 [Candidatus Heimdallarchaeota archaeon LC_2]OLS27650.1 MAG: hypothetical protein HeimC2_10980 [Candidatus Heimdallarchaeota archaeon LC_2]
MKGTIYINLDLETYVPISGRNNKSWHMDGNPVMKENFLMGGTFSHQNPNKANLNNMGKFNSYWIWNEDSFDPNNPNAAEKDILINIYEYISNLN